jgi:hypothetical protein
MEIQRYCSNAATWRPPDSDALVIMSSHEVGIMNSFWEYRVFASVPPHVMAPGSVVS